VESGSVVLQHNTRVCLLYEVMLLHRPVLQGMPEIRTHHIQIQVIKTRQTCRWLHSDPGHQPAAQHVQTRGTGHESLCAAQGVTTIDSVHIFDQSSLQAAPTWKLSIQEVQSPAVQRLEPSCSQRNTKRDSFTCLPAPAAAAHADAAGKAMLAAGKDNTGSPVLCYRTLDRDDRLPNKHIRCMPIDVLQDFQPRFVFLQLHAKGGT
jgi:hypothetical protein